MIERPNQKFCKSCHKWHTPLTVTGKSHQCGQCKQCHTICTCRNRAGAIYVPSSNPGGIGSSSMCVKSRRAIGLELELSNFGDWRVIRDRTGRLGRAPWECSYTIVRDGSVHPSGLEAVFDPMYGDQMVINGLNAIAEHVYTNNCEVNDSCGYHVHVNAQDFNWYDIQRTMMFWLALEKYEGLNRLAGRLPNTFCQTWSRWIVDHRLPLTVPYDIKTFKSWVTLALYNITPEKLRQEEQQIRLSKDYKHHQRKYKAAPEEIPRPRIRDYSGLLTNYLNLRDKRGWNHALASRYLNLNIHSWRYRGTLEYRIGAGTVDPHDIRMWPLFCLWLTEVMALTSTSIVQSMIKLNVDPLRQLVDQRGINIPSISGSRLYPLPDFLLHWIGGKL